jgi:hypothetical protein
MIAQVLARAETIELNEDVLLISFPENRALFKDRLKDKGSLAAIEAAAEEAVGQSVRVLAGLASGEPAPTSQPSTPPPPIRDTPTRPAEPTGAEEAARKKLWQRAEEEPLVSRFIEELGGQLTDVEEI